MGNFVELLKLLLHKEPSERNLLRCVNDDWLEVTANAEPEENLWGSSSESSRSALSQEGEEEERRGSKMKSKDGAGSGSDEDDWGESESDENNDWGIDSGDSWDDAYHDDENAIVCTASVRAEKIRTRARDKIDELD